MVVLVVIILILIITIVIIIGIPAVFGQVLSPEGLNFSVKSSTM